MDRHSFYFHVYQAITHGKPFVYSLAVQITDDGRYFWVGWRPEEGGLQTPYLTPGVLIDRMSRHARSGVCVAPAGLFRRPLSVDVVTIVQYDQQRYAFTRFGMADWLSAQALENADEWLDPKTNELVSLIYFYKDRRFECVYRYDLDLDCLRFRDETWVDETDQLRLELCQAPTVQWSPKTIYKRLGLLGLQWLVDDELSLRVAALEAQAYRELHVPFFRPSAYSLIRAHVLNTLKDGGEWGRIEGGL